MNSPLLTPLASNARLTDAGVAKVESMKVKTEFQTRSAVGSNIDNFTAVAPDLIERTTVRPSQLTRSRSVSGPIVAGRRSGCMREETLLHPRDWRLGETVALNKKRGVGESLFIHGD